MAAAAAINTVFETGNGKRDEEPVVEGDGVKVVVEGDEEEEEVVVLVVLVKVVDVEVVGKVVVEVEELVVDDVVLVLEMGVHISPS